MKFLLAGLLVIVLVSSAVAFDLGNRAPAKPAALAQVAPPPDPAVLRQGGDTIADAVPIPIPTLDLAGTTTGYADDYDEMCPFGAPFAPDVVYTFTPATDMLLDIDLCGSEYDTKTYVYDQNLDLIGCNDDFYGGPPCGLYVSKIERLPVQAGVQYFLIVDGFNGAYGNYLLDVEEYVPCVLECPAAAELEGEPPLTDDYVDLHNGGCNTDEIDPPLQPIAAATFCGVSGWYVFQGANYRDTDWFTVQIPASGVLEITGDAEHECSLFELGPQDCAEVGVVQDVIIGECAEGTMTVVGDPGATVWFWVGPTSFQSPDGSNPYEFDYTLWLNLDVVATEDHSWSEVKALFD